MNIARMDKFETLWAARHDLPAESLAQYRFESREGYRLPELAAHYRTFCMALEYAEECNRRSQILSVDESLNVVWITPQADRMEFVLTDEKFDSLTELMNINKMGDNKPLENLMTMKNRWVVDESDQ